MKRALVCGGGGFIGGHLINRLKSEGYWVRGVDLKYNEYGRLGLELAPTAHLRFLRAAQTGGLALEP